MDIDPVMSSYSLASDKTNILIPIHPGTMFFYLLMDDDEIDPETFHRIQCDWYRQLSNPLVQFIRLLIRYRFHDGYVRFGTWNRQFNETECTSADYVHFESDIRRIPKTEAYGDILLLQQELVQYRVSQRGILYYIWLTRNIDHGRRVIVVPATK